VFFGELLGAFLGQSLAVEDEFLAVEVDVTDLGTGKGMRELAHGRYSMP
jgi:hypothetical protein